MIEKLIDIGKSLFEGLGTTLLDKYLNKPEKEKSVIINNFHIGDVINLQRGDLTLTQNVALLVKHIKYNSKDLLIEKLGNEFSQPIINFIHNLPDNFRDWKLSDIQKLKEIKILDNLLVENGKSYTELVDELNLLIDKAKEGTEISKIIESKLIDISEDLRIIKKEELEQLNVGGLVFVVQTNFSLGKDEIHIPELIGFEKIENADSLSSLARNGTIRINMIILKKGDDRNNHLVDIEVENMQNQVVDFSIEKGQIFENKEYQSKSQNLTAADKGYFSLNPFEKKFLQINAYCLNEKMSLPNGKHGNITFYSIKDKSFRNGDDVWKIFQNIISR